MKIVFVLTNALYARNFESTLALLAERGHAVHVVVERMHKRLGERPPVLERLAARHPTLTWRFGPPSEDPGLERLAHAIRSELDFLFYLQPAYDEAPSMREKIATRTATLGPWLAHARLLARPRVRRPLEGGLRALEAALPRRRELDALIAEEQPELVAVTPLAQPATPQVEFGRSARAAGVASAACIHSWDNLTTGGWIRDAPDLVAVWNERQRREAVDLHGLAEERVVSTGAQAWDHWFDWRPARTREELCAEVGLDPRRPFVLFLGSSGYAGSEQAYVDELVTRLAARSDGPLAGVGVLVRPHPQRFVPEFDDLLARGLDTVAVWPRLGADPNDENSRRDYFDSLHHSAGVVGVNTSAFIEAAIVGRSSHTLLLPQFAHAQDRLIHFRYLREDFGGPLRVARTWEDHLSQIAASVADPEHDRERNQRFVRSFARPHGPATPRLVAALEEAARRGPVPAADDPSWAPALGLALRPVAGAFGLWAERHRFERRRLERRLERRWRRSPLRRRSRKLWRRGRAIAASRLELLARGEGQPERARA